MKQIQTLFVTVASLFFVSCNSGDDKKADASTSTSMATSLFKIIMIQHPVANFDTWKTAYTAHDSMRQAYGLTHFLFGRGTDDSKMVLVINKMNDVRKAKDFSNLPELTDAMEKAGVTGTPTFSFLDVVRNDDAHIEQKDRVMIAHHVKDFEAWLKVYDAEGIHVRKENGLLDRGLARGIDDPDMVFIVFAITDMEKAKARINSEDLKKIMTGAGVEGAPQIMYYRIAD